MTSRQVLEDRLRACADRVADLREMVAQLAEEISELTGVIAGAADPWQNGVQALLQQHQAEIAELIASSGNSGAGATASTAFPFRLDPLEREIRIGRRRVSLTPQEFKVIELLWEQMPSTVSREAILERLYGKDRSQSDRVVDVFISNIRQKLHIAGATDVSIRSRARQGWHLELHMLGVTPSFERAQED